MLERKTENTPEVKVGSKYKVGRKIGSGSFGDIYYGKHNIYIYIYILGKSTQTAEEVAIKMVIHNRCALYDIYRSQYLPSTNN